MSRPPGWCHEYVGLPFGEKGRGPSYDCWGLARKVRQDHLGETDVPDYVQSYTSTHDKESVAAAVTAGLMAGWQQIPGPVPFCLVILKLAGRPWHCGVMADDFWMLHTMRGIDAVVERIDSLSWRNRVEGFYERC